VVDAIVDGADSGMVIRLAVLIAVIALAEAGLGLVTRCLSARPLPGMWVRRSRGRDDRQGGRQGGGFVECYVPEVAEVRFD
jgi:hypothetical protein